ncbi:hypothetical protein [Lysinibacillus sp. RS5]|uniref:hypothetical protein n=1 Tax=unclassified Lysinibacillus TaxID=2636778 RepID=UPI0035BE514B
MIDIFWLCYLGILAIASIGILIKDGYKTTFGVLDFVFSFVTWIGLFGYVTNNQILTPIVWKFVFIIGLLFDIVFGFKKFNEDINYDGEPLYFKLAIFVITFIIFIGPLYFGLFNYAFK